MTTLVLTGELFDGRSLLAQAAVLVIDGERARLEVGEQVFDFEPAELRVSPRVFDAPRFIALPNGATLLCPEQPGLVALTASSASEGPVAWLERRIGVAVGAVLATVIGVGLFYFYGLPRLAEAVATHVPVAREAALGKSALKAFDASTSATDLDDESVRYVERGFALLERGLPSGTAAHLEFRNASRIGPNAFALPGGTVVITDELIELCSLDEAIVVLAHELGHVQHRHALKLFLQQFGVGALGEVIGADASGLSLSVSGLPIMLAKAQYSQSFEREADAAGFALAAKAGYSPDLFASCLAKLGKHAAHGTHGVMGYLSTHPPDAERVVRAHEAARRFARHGSVISR